MFTRVSLLAVALAGTVVPALAADYHGTARFDWTYAPLALEGLPGQYFTVGQAVGTMVRDAAAPAAIRSMAETCNNIDLADGTATSVCVATDSDGDRYWVSASCGLPMATPPEGAMFACEGKATLLGGTGKFSAITGVSSFVQVLTEIREDGTLVGYSTEQQDLSY